MHESDADYISPADLTQPELEDKEYSGGLFQEDPDEDELPYAQIPNILARLPTMTFECKGVLLYLLSNKPGWKIRTSQILRTFKAVIGREKLRRIIKEAISFGYIKVEHKKEGNLLRLEYYISRSGKFKKCFPQTGFKGPEIECPENPPPKNTIIPKKTIEKNICPPSADPPPPSASELTHFFFATLQEINPKIRPPNMVKWSQEMYRLQNVDKRSETEVRMLINYLKEEHFNSSKDFTWSQAVNSPNALRNNFDKIWLQMEKVEAKKAHKDPDKLKNEEIQRNKTFATHKLKELKDRLPEYLDFKVDETKAFTDNHETRVYLSVGFTEPNFESKLIKILQREKLI